MASLQSPWVFTYFKKAPNKSYEDNTSTLGTVRTVGAHPAPPLLGEWAVMACG